MEEGQQQDIKALQQNLSDRGESSSSSSSVDFDADSPNQKFFNIADVKPLDLKGQWLGNTNEMISRFETKMQQLKEQKKLIKAHFEEFAENENRFRISSLRKIEFLFDKKALYLQFMKRSRKTIQKLHPSLLINIFSYVQDNVFLVLTRMRRVSQVFNFIYKNEQVITLFAQRDFGQVQISLAMQQKWCQRYVSFCQTFLYYKQIKYTELIPQNSIKQDLEKAVDFINEVYKRVYLVKNQEIGYFLMVNRFMKVHRVAIALESLAFAELAVTRKASIIAFSNYLAFNPASRLKEQITKTKYLKMIHLVQEQVYRDSLVVNSRISNFLLEYYQYEFAVFVDTLQSADYFLLTETPVLDIVVFHYYNEVKSFFVRGVVLEDGRASISDVELEFSNDLKNCRLEYKVGERVEVDLLNYHFMPTVGGKDRFGRCFIFRGEFYYILIVPSEVLEQNL